MIPIDTELINEARRMANQSGQHLLDLIQENSHLTAENFVQELAQLWQCAAFYMDDLNELVPDFVIISYADAVKRECLFLRGKDDALMLVLADIFDPDLLVWAENKTTHQFTTAIAHRKDIAAYLTRYEDSMRAMDGLLSGMNSRTSGGDSMDDLSLISISEDTSPVVRLVHSTLYDALRSGVSDIHLETDVAQLLIKYRMDGVLNQVGAAEGLDLAEQVISRIKVMSELDIAERRIPQDGRFKISMRGREIDFRVSIMPSIFGEDAVLRILDRSTINEHADGMRLEDLGFDQASVAGFRKLALEPYGMVLVTGPTGSGKTTTLYAAISEINDGRDKIITIEDPVEYRLQGVLQIPVNEKKGLTFARGLRSILRHDPDKIMVGEIRDPETAQIAVQSALTGHLVFTTVHANNVFDVISRFLHMGVDPFSFVSAINGVMSQRLVRIICPNCKVSDVPSMKLLQDSGLSIDSISAYTFKIGRGCGQCRGTGYKGRRAIAEILDINDEIRELIIAKAPIREVKNAARRSGTRFLREAALDLALSGETTLQEINRVTFVD